MVLCALLVVALVGCGSNSGGSRGSEGGGGRGRYAAMPLAYERPMGTTYQVPDSKCPQNWRGLIVTTETDAELQYLDDMPACTNSAGNLTYLENSSPAVWVLRSISRNPGSVRWVGTSARELSFRAIFKNSYTGQVIFSPGAKLVVNLSPDEVEWIVDLALVSAGRHMTL
jgi:hypothetical protein